MSEAQAKDEDEFDLEIEGEETPVQVIDTTPAADKGKALLAEEKASLEDLSEDEIASYSEKVQKRIKDATFKFHDQRRKRESAERERDEAVRFAQEALRRAQATEGALYQYEAGYVDQAKTRVDAEMAQARAALRAAHDVGDADKMAEAQVKIATLAVQQEQYSRFTPREAPAQQEVYTPPVQHRPPADDAEKFLAWREKNQWFDQDEDLRDYAMGVHTRYATSNPEMVGTEDYYQDIERKTRAAFPSKFQSAATSQEAQRTRVSPVAGVSRTTGTDPNARQKITLTVEQMKLCKKLGITPQQYAREQQKLGK